MTQIGRWLSNGALPWIITMPPVYPAGAQTSSDEGDYVTEEPMACPSILRPGYELSPYGYRIEYGTDASAAITASQWGNHELDPLPSGNCGPAIADRSNRSGFAGPGDASSPRAGRGSARGTAAYTPAAVRRCDSPTRRRHATGRHPAAPRDRERRTARRGDPGTAAHACERRTAADDAPGETLRNHHDRCPAQHRAGRVGDT